MSNRDAHFDADWLALREAVDHRSRDEGLVERLLARRPPDARRRVLDLGGGTGSNVRWLAARLPGVEEWTIVDHDAELLRAVRSPPTGSLTLVRGDLEHEGLAEVSRADLVTASALLDLVTAEWVEELTARCVDAGAAALFALSYDGTTVWSDEDPIDRIVRDAVNTHQTGEKGMGRALGPEATAVTRATFESRGWEVTERRTPWRLSGAKDAPLCEALIDGWIEAALEVVPDRAAELRGWRDRRIRALAAGTITLEVGHRDLLALPPGSAAE